MSAYNLITAVDAGYNFPSVVRQSLANSAELAAKYAVPLGNPYVRGVPLYSYGHSYTMYPSPYTTPLTGEYMERVRVRLGMGTGYFRGRSGTPLQDTWAGMLGIAIPASGSSDNRTWTLGSRGIVLMQNYMNESSGSDGGYAKYREGWQNVLESMMLLFSSQSFIQTAAATRTGTWTAYGNAPVLQRWRENSLYFSSAIGSTASFAIPSGDNVYVEHAISDATYNAGSINVSCNGVTLKTITAIDRMKAFTSILDGTPVTYEPCLTEVTGLNAAAGTTGAKTVVITVNEAKTTFLGGVFLPQSNPTPPHVFYAKEPQRNPAATNQGGVTAFNANSPYFETMVDSVDAKFTMFHSLALNPGWDNTTMVASLDTDNNFHPNDWGMERIAESFVDAINAAITSPIAGVMTL